jgi:hypothetical protein
MAEEWQVYEGSEGEERNPDKEHGCTPGRQLEIGYHVELVLNKRWWTPSCTRSHAGPVEDLLDVLTEDTVSYHMGGCSAVEVVEPRGIGLELVEGRHLEPVGMPGALGEEEVVVVVDDSGMVVLQIAGDHRGRQGNPSGLLEGEEHVLGVVKENTAGILVDTLPTGGAADQDRPVRQDSRCASVLCCMGREIVRQLGQNEHNRPQRRRQNPHRTCPPVSSYAHHVGCGLGNLARRRSGSAQYFRQDLGTSSH